MTDQRRTSEEEKTYQLEHNTQAATRDTRIQPWEKYTGSLIATWEAYQLGIDATWGTLFERKPHSTTQATKGIPTANEKGQLTK